MTWFWNATVTNPDHPSPTIHWGWSAVAALKGLPATASAIGTHHSRGTRLRGTGRDCERYQESNGHHCCRETATHMSSQRLHIIKTKVLHKSIFQQALFGCLSPARRAQRTSGSSRCADCFHAADVGSRPVSKYSGVFQ
jgi:hypothetical protein